MMCLGISLFAHAPRDILHSAMPSLTSQIEAVLFVSSQPMKLGRIQKLLAVNAEEVGVALAALEAKWNTEDSGVWLMRTTDEVQLMSRPEHAEIIAEFVKDDMVGELTRPSLETLAIIAYRQPISKPELEHIRGVNCSLILRNLLMRGLIAEREDSERMQIVYTTTMDFVRLLGVTSVTELPEYNALREHPLIADMVAAADVSAEPSVPEVTAP